MSQILVTGAHGFLGRHLSRALARSGATVHGVGHGEWSQAEWREWGLSSWSTGDVSPSVLARLDVPAPSLVVHCAGGSSVARSIADPEGERARTVDSTRAALTHAARCGASLVLPSSVAVYGMAERLPIDEQHPLRPVSPYGRHKLEAEELVRAASAQGTPAAIVRLFSVYGPGLRKQLLWDACCKLARGESSFAGTGNETRDWLHVSDATRLLAVATGQTNPSCPVVNGGTGEAISTRAVLELLSEQLDAGPVAFTGLQRAGDPPHHQADVSRARSWGWSSLIDWRAGALAYVQWFQGQRGQQGAQG